MSPPPPLFCSQIVANFFAKMFLFVQLDENAKFPIKRRLRLTASAEYHYFTTLSTLLLLNAKECPRGDLNPHGLAANGF